jgi:CubicO group peptidase (beta-lactamase class C family)
MRWFVCVAIALAGTLVSERALAQDDSALVSDVEAMRRAWNQPGIALAIVRGEEVSYAGGFGVRRLGRSPPVTADTVFALASCSKSFAAASVGRLVEQGRVSWDDPVQQHLADFQLYDAWVSQQVTLRDLLSMRTGLRGAGIARLAASDRRDLVRRMRYLPPAAPFRSELIYTTDNYTAVGAVVSEVMQEPWERFADREFWRPIGMARTNADHRQARAMADAAHPHVRINGQWRPTSWYYEDHIAVPAGGVNSSVRDVAAWLGALLNGGVWRGVRVLSQETIDEMFTPHTPDRGSQDSHILTGPAGQGPDGVMFEAYAMGWMTHSYRGQRVVWHDGSIEGFRCVMSLLPDQRAGFVLLFNADQDYLPYALMQRVNDHLLEVTPRDWLKLYRDFELEEQSAPDATAEVEFELGDAIVGRYADNGLFGDAHIRESRAGRLQLDLGNVVYDLTPAGATRLAATPRWRYQREPEFTLEFENAPPGVRPADFQLSLGSRFTRIP